MIQILNRLVFPAIFIVCTSCNGQEKPGMRTEQGVATKTLASGRPKLVKTQRSNQYQAVRCGIQDKNGNIWFGTTGEGVYKFDGKLFTQYTTNDGLSNNNVWSVLEDKDGNIWFGTTDGICRFDGKKIVAFPIPFFIRPVINNNTYYTEWSTKSTVWSMLQDKSGKIWFGTGDGVYCYNGISFTRFLYNDNVINKDSLQLKLVSGMLQDKNGIIWFASGMPPGCEGFCRYDGKTIVSFKPKDEGWIRNITESRNGNILLATRHFGVWTYDGKSFTDYAQPKELIKGSLSAILEDKSGNLWIASGYGNEPSDTLGGLWKSDLPTDARTEQTFTKITGKGVYFIFEDKNNNIWFGTGGMALYRFDGKSIVCLSE